MIDWKERINEAGEQLRLMSESQSHNIFSENCEDEGKLVLNIVGFANQNPQSNMDLIGLFIANSHLSLTEFIEAMETNPSIIKEPTEADKMKWADFQEKMINPMNGTTPEDAIAYYEMMFNYKPFETLDEEKMYMATFRMKIDEHIHNLNHRK